jgi:NAD(P)H-dependent nitrite reductase small subunit
MSTSISVESTQLPSNNNGVRIVEGDKDIALFCVDGTYFAIDNECPHQGASLSDGWVDEGVVACPWHCWQFDVANGRCLTFDGFNLTTYPVRIEDGNAFIDVA